MLDDKRREHQMQQEKQAAEQRRRAAILDRIAATVRVEAEAYVNVIDCSFN